MKYFTREFMDEVNDIDLGPDESAAAYQKFERRVGAYLYQLEQLRPRISKTAFKFFRWGAGPTGLHDAHLLAFTAGDGANFKPDGSEALMVNRVSAFARFEILNFEQDLHYIFELQKVRRVQADLFIDEDFGNGSFAYVSTYELTAPSEDQLQLGFLFSTGAMIVVQFGRLFFRKRRLKPTYDRRDIYGVRRR